MKKDPAKFALALLATGYCLWCAYAPYRWHLIDGVNLFNHEAGHIIFSPFGQFITVAGGTLLQLIMPAAFTGYFFHRREFYNAAIPLFWLGQSMVNVSVYAGDAVLRELPLLWGPGSGHDWAYLLGRLGLLPFARELAALVWFGGTAIILTAAYIAFKYAVPEIPAGPTAAADQPPAAPAGTI